MLSFFSGLLDLRKELCYKLGIQSLGLVSHDLLFLDAGKRGSQLLGGISLEVFQLFLYLSCVYNIRSFFILKLVKNVGEIELLLHHFAFFFELCLEMDIPLLTEAVICLTSFVNNIIGFTFFLFGFRWLVAVTKELISHEI